MHRLPQTGEKRHLKKKEEEPWIRTLGHLGVHRQEASDPFSERIRALRGGLGVVEPLDGDFVNLKKNIRREGGSVAAANEKYRSIKGKNVFNDLQHE